MRRAALVALLRSTASRFRVQVGGMLGDVHGIDREAAQLSFIREATRARLPQRMIAAALGVTLGRVQRRLRRYPVAVEQPAGLGDLGADIAPEVDALARRIVGTTAEEFGLPVERLIGRSLVPAVTIPRMLAMARVRDATRLSYPRIARLFRAGDHTTVLYACRRAAGLHLTPAMLDRYWPGRPAATAQRGRA